MSAYDYKQSRKINDEGYGFFALLMATMRRADTENAERLGRAFPETWSELRARYNAPGGVLPGDEMNELPL